jgi:hypothetical protein
VVAVIVVDVLFGLLVSATLTAAAARQVTPTVVLVLQLPLAILAIVLWLREQSVVATLLAVVLPVAGYLAESVHLAALVFGVMAAVLGYRHEHGR